MGYLHCALHHHPPCLSNVLLHFGVGIILVLLECKLVHAHSLIASPLWIEPSNACYLSMTWRLNCYGLHSLHNSFDFDDLWVHQNKFAHGLLRQQLLYATRHARILLFIRPQSFFKAMLEFINCVMELPNTSMNKYTIDRNKEKKIGWRSMPAPIFQDFVEEGGNLYQWCASRFQIACQLALSEQTCVD
jgi:hypothetical protein